MTYDDYNQDDNDVDVNDDDATFENLFMLISNSN